MCCQCWPLSSCCLGTFPPSPFEKWTEGRPGDIRLTWLATFDLCTWMIVSFYGFGNCSLVTSVCNHSQITLSTTNLNICSFNALPMSPPAFSFNQPSFLFLFFFQVCFFLIACVQAQGPSLLPDLSSHLCPLLHFIQVFLTPRIPFDFL